MLWSGRYVAIVEVGFNRIRAEYLTVISEISIFIECQTGVVYICSGVDITWQSRAEFFEIFHARHSCVNTE